MSGGVPFDELFSLTGRSFTGEPFRISREDKERFEQATWVDRAYPEEADEFPENIIEGFHLLSLLDPLFQFIGAIDMSTCWGLNYGGDRVRFVSPIYVDDLVIPTYEIIEVTAKDPGVIVRKRATLAVQGAPRPGLVAEWRVYLQRRGQPKEDQQP